MTLADIELPISYADASGYALVFGKPLADRLAELHAQHGTPNCWPIAAPTGDGRYYLHAHVLCEVAPGGMLHAMWSAADPAILLPSVEVLPLADVLPPEQSR